MEGGEAYGAVRRRRRGVEAAFHIEVVVGASGKKTKWRGEASGHRAKAGAASGLRDGGACARNQTEVEARGRIARRRAYGRKWRWRLGASVRTGRKNRGSGAGVCCAQGSGEGSVCASASSKTEPTDWGGKEAARGNEPASNGVVARAGNEAAASSIGGGKQRGVTARGEQNHWRGRRAGGSDDWAQRARLSGV